MSGVRWSLPLRLFEARRDELRRALPLTPAGEIADLAAVIVRRDLTLAAVAEPEGRH
jgi:hypothetical protein